MDGTEARDGQVVELDSEPIVSSGAIGCTDL